MSNKIELTHCTNVWLGWRFWASFIAQFLTDLSECLIRQNYDQSDYMMFDISATTVEQEFGINWTSNIKLDVRKNDWSGI